MSTIFEYKIDVHRRLCIKKDLSELKLWTTMLEDFNTELDYFGIIEKQLVKMISVSQTIQAIRRKIVLTMANLYKYEQELKTEYEYGKVEYDANRLKVHEHKRHIYLKLVEEHQRFKIEFYTILKKYQIK
ncbi:hypothetical protein [Winogradskyella schleiferi]|uniref:hypothetical protein n=1 Tax=Winogradskyella schleiferi TaxID=2686078 RepID=UPI0015BF54E4|nr:hypothetical protein [Winogradskyella schleiferi]